MQTSYLFHLFLPNVAACLPVRLSACLSVSMPSRVYRSLSSFAYHWCPAAEYTQTFVATCHVDTQMSARLSVHQSVCLSVPASYSFQNYLCHVDYTSITPQQACPRQARPMNQHHVKDQTTPYDVHATNASKVITDLLC